MFRFTNRKSWSRAELTSCRYVAGQVLGEAPVADKDVAFLVALASDADPGRLVGHVLEADIGKLSDPDTRCHHKPDREQSDGAGGKQR